MWSWPAPVPGEAEKEQRHGPKCPETSREVERIRRARGRFPPLANDPFLRFRVATGRGRGAPQGIPASQLVRAATLAAAEERLDRPAEAPVPPGYLALIEDIYRGVYLLTTLRREELIHAKRKRQLDSIVKDGRLAMKETMDEGPA